ncbi:hypothetical protein [Simkania sp.]|uniref:hypothetical protein n=1 Tax=Simkania sp. TaxID=34094 RepID=UPI003B519E7D
MKMVNKIFNIIGMAIICCFVTQAVASENVTPFKQFNFSLWSEYTRVDFDGMTQAQKTEKLQSLFRDQLNFVKRHGTRKLIVKILDPSQFAFFHPANFDGEKEDNFYFWACQLANYAQLEALFDVNSFKLTSESIFDRLAGCYGLLRDYFGKQDKPFGNFQNVIEKMEWIAWVNEIYEAKERNQALIAGITLDPQGIGNLISYYQNLVNAFDQFRFESTPGCSVPEWIPENSYSGLKIGMLLPIDLKDFALANCADFPLHSELRSPKDSSKLGISVPENFPSTAPNFEPPPWRSIAYRNSLLDVIYLNFGDSRLVAHIYQNYEVLPHPEKIAPAKTLEAINHNFQLETFGIPYLKGPGFIKASSSSINVQGNYTFFRTGSTRGEGQFIHDQQIQVFLPGTNEKVIRTVVGTPASNKEMTLSSPFSATHSFDKLEYWTTATPSNWTTPMISQRVNSKIYFVFSSSFESEKDKYFGNWHYGNFSRFIHSFLARYFFIGLNGEYAYPTNNLVLHDFTTLPNGKPFPDVNWGLGNQNY